MVAGQDVMADHLRNILGDMLYVHTIDSAEQQLPAPAQLRNKVLIKAKRLPPDASSNEGEDDEDDDENEEASVNAVEKKKNKKKKLSKKLSDLVNYIHAVHFPGFDNAEAKFYHMSSFGEDKTGGILKNTEQCEQFVKYNTRQISR